MPITYVNIQWPNNQKDQIYSPSSVIKDYFEIGESMDISNFLSNSNNALTEASERVRKKFGYACTAAQAEAIRIKEKSEEFETSKKVKIISIT